MSNNMSRRSFLQTSAMAAAGAAVASSPLWSSANASAAEAAKKVKKVAATDKLNIVGVGIGGRGAADINGMASQNIVALCDCDWNYAADEMSRYPNAKKYKDYRKMFDKMLDKADAVLVATADHTHSIIAADAIAAGGTDNCTIPLGLVGFGNLKALSRATDPKYASLPFNLNRGGFVMADGASVLILEEYEHAKARGAKIYAEMVGYGSTCDAFHATAPRPDGSTQARCITDACEEAEFDAAKDTVYINAHGTGTKLNDVAETIAYKNAFGDFAYKCHISSTKSMHGHMLGATGSTEAIAAILALHDGIVPPTINLDTPDPECDLDYTPCKAVKADITLSLSDSFGFGGHNACLAFRRI